MANRKIMHKKKIRNWQKEMRNLMDGFCISPEQIETIIASVSGDASGHETQLLLYERAWNKMYDII